MNKETIFTRSLGTVNLPKNLKIKHKSFIIRASCGQLEERDTSKLCEFQIVMIENEFKVQNHHKMCVYV